MFFSFLQNLALGTETRAPDSGSPLCTIRATRLDLPPVNSFGRCPHPPGRPRPPAKWEELYKKHCEHWADQLHQHLSWPQPCSHCDVVKDPKTGKYEDAGEPPSIGYNYIPGVTDLANFCSFNPATMGECMKNGKECFHQDAETKETASCKEAHWPAGNGHHVTNDEATHSSEYHSPHETADAFQHHQ